MARFNRENFVKNLPDTYAKSTSSNNYKILEIERTASETLRESLGEIYEILDIDNATGKTLDLYGERVGQARGLMNDDQYRVLIKAKIMRNLVNGTNQAICEALCYTFGCERSDICMTEYMPCVIMVTEFPVEKVNEAGFTATQALTIIRSLLPICMTLEPIVVDGTFCFAAGEDEYDDSAGFTDVEGGTIGGTLSSIYGAEENIPLPI